MEIVRAKFLPSFARQRNRGGITEKKKFVKEEFLPSKLASGDVDVQDGCTFEIGAGNGETAVRYATLFPQDQYIAAEVFPEGLLQTACKIYDAGLSNVLFWRDDARIFLDDISKKLGRIFVFFPDPWPKKRHNKRRILNNEFLNMAFKALKSGGEILVATDHELYKDHILELASTQNLFIFEEIVQPEWWAQTKYQGKAIREGRTSQFYKFTKLEDKNY